MSAQYASTADYQEHLETGGVLYGEQEVEDAADGGYYREYTDEEYHEAADRTISRSQCKGATEGLKWDSESHTYRPEANDISPGGFVEHAGASADRDVYQKKFTADPQSRATRFVDNFYNKYEEILNLCAILVFDDEWRRMKMGRRTRDNAPALDVTKTSKELAKMPHEDLGPVGALPDPMYGMHGLVYIAKEIFDSDRPEDQARAEALYAHELGNLLDDSIFGGASENYMHHRGFPADSAEGRKDDDTGHRFEVCFTGGYEAFAAEGM